MFRVRVQFNGVPGTPYLATHYFNDEVGTAQTVATAAGNFWGAVDAQMDSDVNWQTIADVATVDSATGQITGSTATAPVTGSGAVSAVQTPRIAQGLVRWTTGVYLNGRQIRGRTFVPGLTVNAVALDGEVAAATQAVMNAAAAALIADANTNFVVYSPATQSEALVTAGQAWNEFASLRSRRD